MTRSKIKAIGTFLPILFIGFIHASGNSGGELFEIEVGFEARKDNNILRNNNQISDFVLRPGIKARYNNYTGIVNRSVRFETVREVFMEYDSENSQDYELDVDSSILSGDISQLELSLNGFYRRINEPFIFLGDRIRRDRIGADATVKLSDESPDSFLVGLNYLVEQYDADDFLDVVRLNGIFAYSYSYRRDSELIVEANLKKNKVKSEDSFDGYAGLVGVSGKIYRNLSGKILVGAEHWGSERAVGSKDERVKVVSELEWAFNRDASLRLNFRSDSYVEGNNVEVYAEYLNFSFSKYVSHSGLSLFFEVESWDAKYKGLEVDRKDENLEFRLQLGKDIGKSGNIYLGVVLGRNESNRESFEFNRSSYYLGVSFVR